MIERLDVLNNTINVFAADNNVANVAAGMDTIDKINEIIDELNHILEERESDIKVYEEVVPNIKPADTIAEQRKWIGELYIIDAYTSNDLLSHTPDAFVETETKQEAYNILAHYDMTMGKDDDVVIRVRKKGE